MLVCISCVAPDYLPSWKLGCLEDSDPYLPVALLLSHTHGLVSPQTPGEEAFQKTAYACCLLLLKAHLA